MTAVKNPDGTVTISWEEYKKLTKDQDTLNALYAAGVDNWEGMGEVDWPKDEDDDD